MSQIDDILRDLRERWPAVPAAAISSRILELMLSLPASQMKMITFGSLKSALKLPDVGQDLVTAVTILTNSPIAALDAKALFIDGDFEKEMSSEAALRAWQTGEVVHPQTGDVLADGLDHVLPFFVPSQRFLEMREAG